MLIDTGRDLWVLAFPLVGGIVGWFTNVLAIKMLFRPHDPVKIPFLPWSIQRVLPRRKAELASRIGQVVEQDLVPTGRLTDELLDHGFKRRIMERVGELVFERVYSLLPGFVPGGIKEAVSNYILNGIARQGENLVDDAVGLLEERLGARGFLARLVEQRVLELDMRELEDLILKVSRKELRGIEILGGLIGFVIGLVQMSLVLLFGG